MFNIWGILAAWVATIGACYFLGRHDGMTACEERHTVAVAEVKETVRKSDEKRNRQKPVTAHRAAQYDWLLNHAGE
jgi:hypothetical protein